MIASTATLALTPWAAEALSLAEQDELARRLVDAHARAGVIRSSRGWKIIVDSWAKGEYGPLHNVTRYHQRGHLADLVHYAIDEYERLFAFTPDELVTIAAQSGVEVSRA